MAKVYRAAKKIYKKVKNTTRGASSAYMQSKSFDYYLDSPKETNLGTNRINIEGWVLPKDSKKIADIKVKFGPSEYSIKHGVERKDVAKVYPHNPSAKQSGFSREIEIDGDGILIIEIKVDGADYEKIYEANIHYSPEKLVGDLINPELAKNWAEHVNLQNNKHNYFYEDAVAGSYKRAQNDPRLMAFYLPQFHPIAENNKVWGEGFTEWTNVTSDTPRFIGHTQPILPKNTGFYDLRLKENMASQIERAKKHGIYGFCFYYYWFSGKRLLEEPLDMFLSNKSWDFNFTICWANENWTKRWDGRDNEVIIAQKYHAEDPLRFIKDVESILIDPRYIREDDKPVLIVFRASELKDPSEYARVWREYFREKHNTELHLVSIISFENKDPREYGFDMALDFAPQSSFFKNETFKNKKYPFLDVSNKLIDKDFSGLVADYREIALNQKTYEYFDYPSYKCVTPSWDNDARKKNKGFVMKNESPDIYAKWLDNVLHIETKKRPDPLVFINAWNEWAEGAVLEPTMHYGSSVLNRTTEVLAQYSQNNSMREEFPRWQLKRANCKIAVVIHLYYPERWEEIKTRLQYLDEDDYDIFVSLNIKNKSFENTIYNFRDDAVVQVVPNRGRDVLPFINLLPKLKAAGYESVLKLHSKKSLHRDNGADWFEDMLEKLLPSKVVSKDILSMLDKNDTLIGPAGHFVSLGKYMGGNEKCLTGLLSTSINDDVANRIINQANGKGYFAGSMFWASLDVLEPLSNLNLLPEDFESESGQIDGTLAHAVERYITVMAKHEYKCFEVGQNGLTSTDKVQPSITYPYAD